jgi:hypothetical protein
MDQPVEFGNATNPLHPQTRVKDARHSGSQPGALPLSAIRLRECALSAA